MVGAIGAARRLPYGAPMVDPFAVDVPEELATARLVLRAAEIEDADDLHAAIAQSRDHLRPFAAWAQLDLDLDDIECRIRRHRGYFAARDSFEWLLWSHDTSTLFGSIDLHSCEWALGRAELGFWLTATAQGQGYVVEAAAAVLAVGHQWFPRIEARCDVRNARSRATLARCGFSHEGTLRARMRGADGALTDECIFAHFA